MLGLVKNRTKYRLYSGHKNKEPRGGGGGSLRIVRIIVFVCLVFVFLFLCRRFIFIFILFWCSLVLFFYFWFSVHIIVTSIIYLFSCFKKKNKDGIYTQIIIRYNSISFQTIVDQNQ